MTRLKILLLALAGLAAMPARAEWPERTITIAPGFSAGGVAFVISQALANRLTQKLGKPVIVEEKSGASGTIAGAYVARSSPEGYVFGVMSNSTMIAQLMQPKLPYDPSADLIPVSKIVEAPLVLAVSKKLPVANLREFISLVRAEPGKYSYGSTGVGSSPHFGGEMLKQAAGLNMVHIPYRGSPPMNMALRTGDLAMFFDIPGNVIPLVEDGTARMVAVASSKTYASTGDTPPLSSQVPGLEISYWMGMYARAGTPAPIVKRMADEVASILQEPEMQSMISKWKLSVVGSTPAQFQDALRSEVKVFEPLVKQLGLKPGD